MRGQGWGQGCDKNDENQGEKARRRNIRFRENWLGER